jgi:hypothetical protein
LFALNKTGLNQLSLTYAFISAKAFYYYSSPPHKWDGDGFALLPLALANGQRITSKKKA